MKLNLVFERIDVLDQIIEVGLIVKTPNGTNIRFAQFDSPPLFDWDKMGEYGQIEYVQSLLGDVGFEYTLEQVSGYKFENPSGKNLMIMPDGKMYLGGVPTCQHLPNLWVQDCYQKWVDMDVAKVPISTADIDPKLISAMSKGYGIDFCDPEVPQTIITALTEPVNVFGPSMFGHEDISLQVGDRVEIMLSNAKIDWRIKLAAVWYAAIHSKPWLLIEPLFKLKDYVHSLQNGVVVFEDGGPNIPVSGVWNGDDYEFARNIFSAINSQGLNPTNASRHFVSAFYEVTTKLSFMEQRILCDIALKTMKNCLLAIHSG